MRIDLPLTSLMCNAPGLLVGSTCAARSLLEGYRSLYVPRLSIMPIQAESPDLLVSDALLGCGKA